MSDNDHGNGNGFGDGPGLGVDELKRKPVGDSVFETSLTTAQCQRILRATARHDINFRPLARGAKEMMLVQAMRHDLWVWTDADPIRLHLHVESGEVVCSDGQHRLAAAVAARRTLRCLVLWGDQWRAGVHVDRNKMRTVAQFLQHEHGIGSASVYAALTRQHLGRLIAHESGLAMTYARNTMDDATVIDFVLKEYDRLHWAINRGAAGSGRGFSMTGYAVVLYELETISDDVATQFHDDFLNNDLSPTDPLAQLRRSVGRKYNDTGIRSTVGYTINNMVKAHNQRSANEEVTRWVNAPSDDVVFPAGFRIDGQRVTKGARR